MMFASSPKFARALLAVIATALFLPAHAAATTVLKLDEANPPDGRVLFRPGICEIVPQANTPNLSQMIQAQTDHYDLYLDPDRVELANFGYFVYAFYVRPRISDGSTGSLCYFRVQAIPKDSFVDTFADVSFQVGETTNLENGTISMPLHNTSYHKPILQSISPDSLYKVRLSGGTTLSLHLENVLPNLAVRLGSKVYAGPENRDYWSPDPSASLRLNGQTQLNPGQSLDDGLELTLQPKSWRALGASIFPVGPKQAHETVHLRLDFSTPGGVSGTFEIPVRIRFQPSFWGLLLSVLVGAGLGSLLGWVIPSAPASGAAYATYKKFIVAFAGSILVEILGMLLVLKDSEFRILGFQLDPYQLLPAFVVGALIALLSFRNADTVLKWIKA